MWRCRLVQQMGFILGSLAAMRRGTLDTPGVMQGTAVSISTVREAWAEPNLVFLWLGPSTSCPPLPHSNIFSVRLGETLRSPPDASTNHASSWIPFTGNEVSAHLFEVAPHPALHPWCVCPVRPPGRPRHFLSSLESHARKDSL